jgi:predicted nucleotide-binding protein (sugar kinase/HSP70/actin superfamily)
MIFEPTRTKTPTLEDLCPISASRPVDPEAKAFVDELFAQSAREVREEIAAFNRQQQLQQPIIERQMRKQKAELEQSRKFQEKADREALRQQEKLQKELLKEWSYKILEAVRKQTNQLP